METTSLAKEEEGIIRCCASVVRARATRDTPAGEKASVDEDARKAAATRLGTKRTIDVDISIDELVEVFGKCGLCFKITPIWRGDIDDNKEGECITTKPWKNIFYLLIFKIYLNIQIYFNVFHPDPRVLKSI